MSNRVSVDRVSPQSVLKKQCLNTKIQFSLIKI